MDLYPQSMGLDGGETGKITFEDETGTTIESNGGLVLMAKEGIRLESMTGIAMQGMSDIMALYSEGASSLCVNGSVDMLGRRTSLAGIVYQGYDPFEDAPQKGEFDWGGFARNLAIGLGVAIACVGLALIPGIGPIVTGALIGAAIGTFCQTVYKANEEWQSGNVRSTIETVRDVVISAAAGGFTGACVVAFPVTVLFSGEIYAGVSLTGRAAWALGDSSMNNEKKMAYIFDTKKMAVDFSIGALIGIIVPGAVARKLVRDAERNMLKNTCESGSSSRYDRTGYQSKGRSNNLFGRDRSTRRTTNLTEWRRSISQQDIHNEMRLFLGDDYVKIDSGKWRSLDGTRQFRVKPDDYLGNHGIGQPTVPNTPHVHFEFLTPKSNGNGFDVIKNIHVPIK